MKVRVYVVDDSAISRECLRDVLEAGGTIEVVGEAGDANVALREIPALSPDVVTMDLHMPAMGGLEAIERIMASRPVPILVVTERPTSAGTDVVFEATRRGALDLAAKTGDPRSPEAAHLRTLVARLAKVPVVHHVAMPKPRGPEVGSKRSGPGARPEVVGVGASAGGPSALVELLAPLAGVGACFAVVQHLPEGFTDGFARYLGQATGLRVVVARVPVPLAPDLVVVAPDGAHLVASAGKLAPEVGPPVAGHRASVDVLFHSLARVFAGRAAGALLSGIGRDGAQGLLAMRRAGARTFAQDEASSAVYGMPLAAFEVGAAEEVLAPRAIAARLASLAGKAIA